MVLFSKASYEFVVNLPYEWFASFTINVAGNPVPIFPFLNIISFLNDDIINLAKNIVVLAFFIFLLVIIGLWEIRKFNRAEWKGIEDLDIDERNFQSTEGVESNKKTEKKKGESLGEEVETSKEGSEKLEIKIDDPNNS